MGVKTRNVYGAALTVAVWLLGAMLLQSGLARAEPDAPANEAKSQVKGKGEAQDAPASPEQAAKAAQAAALRKAYEGGLKAYQSGRHQNAIDQLSTALRGSSLNSAEMAKGLYYRGVAYKKLNKPGLAISDLTSALWLKNGLNEQDRKAATAERAEAYRAAGLGDGNMGNERAAVADPRPGKDEAAASPPSSQASASTAVPAPIPNAAPAATPAASAPMSAAAATKQESSGVPQPLTMGAETAAPPPPPAARTAARPMDPIAAEVPTPSYASTSYGSGGGAQGPSQPVLSAVPQDAAPAVPSSGSSSIAGFFSNLFTPQASVQSSAQAPAPIAANDPAAPVTTASTSQSAQTSSWSNQQPSLSQGASAAPEARPAQNAKAAKTAKSPTQTANKAKGGKYKLHIAAVRSRGEAEALAQRLQQEHGSAFPERAATVDEAVIGSMGTFYRVRIGAYANAEEPRGLCNTLRNSGYDCLVVSN